MEKERDICGEVKDLVCDKKIKKLNLELAIDKIGTPIIKFEDWTKKSKSKELFRLHIKEAIELKAIIDNLVFDYNVQMLEESSQDN